MLLRHGRKPVPPSCGIGLRDKCKNEVRYSAAGIWAADALRGFGPLLSAERAANSFGENRPRPIGLFGTIENLTHLTECFQNFSGPRLQPVGFMAEV